LKPYSFQEDSHTYILKPIGLTCGVCVWSSKFSPAKDLYQLVEWSKARSWWWR
jgi:hypothetical protein